MKSLKKNSIILLIITFIVLFCVLKDDFPSIMDALNNANVLFLCLAIICFFGALLFEAMAYKDIIKCYKDDYTLKKSYLMLLITKFFNGITPFSTGGQPMQVYILNKEGIRVTKATNIVIQNFIIYQLALVVLGIFAIGVNYYFDLFEKITLLKQLVTLGFFFNTIIMVGLFVISFNKYFNHFIVNKVISILSKLKVIKNKKEKQEKWKEKLDDFHDGAKYLSNNKFLFVRVFIFNLIYLGLTYLMPYFAILALNDGSLVGVTPLKVICASAYVMIVGSFVPIPGASGGIEYGYYKFFGNFVFDSLLKASLLIWRTISYYLPMIIGGILFSTKVKKGD